jgi:hypothetical protein
MVSIAGCSSSGVIKPAGQVMPIVFPGFRYGGMRQGKSSGFPVFDPGAGRHGFVTSKGLAIRDPKKRFRFIN